MTSIAIPKLLPAARVHMLVGQCVPSLKKNASKIKIKRLTLHPHLLAYYRQLEFIYVTDPEKRCKPGDIVLAEKLPENLSLEISHKIVDVLYPLGDITDPVTGKKVTGGIYRDEKQKEIELYGELPTAFRYDRVPSRGRLEGKRDFSDKPTYTKYHVSENPDPYAV